MQFSGDGKFADFNLDGRVDSADLAALLAAWGERAGPFGAAHDITGDGVVGSGDLGALLSDWG